MTTHTIASIAFSFACGVLFLNTSIPHALIPLPFFWKVACGIACVGIGTGVLVAHLQPPWCLKPSYLLLPLSFLFGCTWAGWHLSQALQSPIPASYYDQPLQVTGVITDLPELKPGFTRFEFHVQTLDHTHNPNHPHYPHHPILNYPKPHPLHLRLNWYQRPPRLQAGDRWRLTIRLKKTEFLHNPGSFNYNAWLMEKGIQAVGTVQTTGIQRHLGTNHSYFVAHLRHQINETIQHSLHHSPMQGLITALAIGVRDEVTELQWQTLRGTGTNHLFAIAGLHIGLVSGIVYAITLFLWRRSPWTLWRPAPEVATMCSLMVAGFYSTMAGFSLPTQRAMIMFGVYALAVLGRRNLALGSGFCLALALILLLEPLSTLSSSFWLSFGAVALILYGLSGRLGHGSKVKHWFRLQSILTLGIIPLSLWFFQQSAWTGFIANAIAIPWVGLLVLPVCLLADFATLWAPWAPDLGTGLWQLAHHMLAPLWPVLTALSTPQWGQWYQGISHVWILWAATVGVLLLLAPRGFPARYLGLVWALPLYYSPPPTPPPKILWLTLLDTRQAMVLLGRTTQETFVYSHYKTPAWGPPAARDLWDVLPGFLEMEGIKRLDRLILTADDPTYADFDLPVIRKQLQQHAPFLKIGTITPCRTEQRLLLENLNFSMSPLAERPTGCLIQFQQGKQRAVIMDSKSRKHWKIPWSSSYSPTVLTLLILPIQYAARDIEHLPHASTIVFTGHAPRRQAPLIHTHMMQLKTKGFKVYSTEMMGAMHFSNLGSPILPGLH